MTEINVLQSWLDKLIKHQNSDLYRQRIAIKERSGITVTLENDRKCINFAGNDYLGFATHREIIAAFNQAAQQYGIGGSASQMISGHYAVHRQFEDAFARFVKRDRALLFVSGFSANLAAISSFADPHCAVFSDKLNHASIVDAIQLAKAKHFRYAHNDMQHLGRRLANSNDKKKIIVTESIFSMLGDRVDLCTILTLAKQHNALLMVDDAHGFGILGERGAGVVEQLQLSQNDVPVLVCPLGKAMGLQGAMVAGSEKMIDYLVQFARPYIYSTAIIPAIAAGGIVALEMLLKETWRRTQLNCLIDYFRGQATKAQLAINASLTPIQTITLGNNYRVVDVRNALLQKGYLVAAIRPPSVPPRTARIRIGLSSLHTQEHIDGLLKALTEILN